MGATRWWPRGIALQKRRFSDSLASPYLKKSAIFLDFNKKWNYAETCIFFQQNDPATRRLSKIHIYKYSIGNNSVPRPPKTSHHLPNCGQRFLSNLSQKFDRFRRQAPTRQVTVPAEIQCPLTLATGRAGARDQRSGSDVIS